MLKLILIAMVLINGTKAYAEEITEAYINEVFARVAKEVDVPVKVLRAICWSESRLNPEGYNHGDGVGTNHAFGICQVLHSTARERGFSDDRCYEDFQDKIAEDGTLVKAKRTFKECKLFGVATNVTLAAKFLKEKLNQYDNSWISAIAAYNTGSLRTCKTGKVFRAKDKSVLYTCKKGGLLNQRYVDGVLKAIEEGR